MGGNLAGGKFTGGDVSMPGGRGPDGPVTLGFRAEDAAVVYIGGEATAAIYTIELLGDATMLTVRAGGQLVSVKAHKEFRAEIGDPVSFSIPAGICHAFDSSSGERLA